MTSYPLITTGEMSPEGSFMRRFLTTMAAASADGVFAVDSGQRIVFWSESAERLSQRPVETVLGQFCFDVVRGVDRQGCPYCRFDCPTTLAVRQGRAVPSYDLQTERSDGCPAWLNISIIPLSDPDAG